jgi:glutaredoxin
MSQFNNSFEPAFKYPIKWSVGDNTFDDKDKNPKTISLCIPVDSIPDLINHLMALESDHMKHKEGKVWIFETKEEKEVPVIYLNGKGREGNYSSCFGNINPQKVAESSSEMPF